MYHASLQKPVPPHILDHHRKRGADIIEDFAVYVRPGVRRFLTEIASFADVYGFTAGTRGYAEPVFRHLDPDRNVFRHVLYRDSCRPLMGGRAFTKDLTSFGQEVFLPQRTLLIDNNPMSFQCQPSNGLLVPDFLGGEGEHDAGDIFNPVSCDNNNNSNNKSNHNSSGSSNSSNAAAGGGVAAATLPGTRGFYGLEYGVLHLLLRLGEEQDVRPILEDLLLRTLYEQRRLQEEVNGAAPLRRPSAG